MTDVTHSRIVICRLDELEDPDSRGMTVTHGGKPCDILVVRQGEQVFGYLNSCPHTGGPLDWVPDQFLNLDREYIQCATHAALFQLHDGECIAGPCIGERLTTVPVLVEAGAVVMLTGAPGSSDH
jgi:nitrite reductase/ring-hydroxylating ferredoxin subunit